MTTFSGEITFSIELEFKIRYMLFPAEPMTHDYPGSPEEIDIVGMAVNGNEIPDDLFEFIMKDHDDEIKETCADHANAYMDEHEVTRHSKPLHLKRRK